MGFGSMGRDSAPKWAWFSRFFEFCICVFTALRRKPLCDSVLEFATCARSRFFGAEVAEAREMIRILGWKPVMGEEQHPKTSEIVNKDQCSSLRCAQTFPGRIDISTVRGQKKVGSWKKCWWLKLGAGQATSGLLRGCGLNVVALEEGIFGVR
jgi:hypothetical protein